MSAVVTRLVIRRYVGVGRGGKQVAEGSFGESSRLLDGRTAKIHPVSLEEQVLEFLLRGCDFGLCGLSPSPVLDERCSYDTPSLKCGLVVRGCGRFASYVPVSLVARAFPAGS